MAKEVEIPPPFGEAIREANIPAFKLILLDNLRYKLRDNLDIGLYTGLN